MKGSTTMSLQLLHTLLLLLTLQILGYSMYAAALPITSKPIESTAENLAWQAWLMLPPELKNLETSRKVTPKSIFTLPFRECPNGHKLFENRCIPIVSIDQESLLTQQLLGILQNEADNNYEFDYDDEMDDGKQLQLPLNVEMGGDESLSSNYDDASQLPNKDEPLKFNLFQQKFPTGEDYESEETAKAAQNNNKTEMVMAMENAMQGFLEKQQQQNQANINTTGQTNETRTSLNVEADFNISDIAAIVLPATSSSSHADLESQNKPEFMATTHKFSLFKDDSNVQLVTSNIAQRTQYDSSESTSTSSLSFTPQDITQLLKDDALLPLVKTVMPQQAALEQVQQNQMQPIASAVEFESTSVLPAAAAYTNSDLMGQASETVETTLSQEQNFKDDHIRSVSQEMLETTSVSSSSSETQQAERSSTTPVSEEQQQESSTHFQLDETTIIEDPPTPLLEMTELQTAYATTKAAIKQPSKEHVILKKSKVEPVEIKADLSSSSTTPMSSSLSPTTPLPTQVAIDDRFYYQHLQVLNNAVSEKETEHQHRRSGGAAIDLPQAATTTSEHASEIDIEQELRMINELVKGNRQALLKTGSTTTESSLTTNEASNENAKTLSTTPQSMKDIAEAEIENKEVKTSTQPQPSLSQQDTLSTTTTYANEDNNNHRWSKVMPALQTTQILNTEQQNLSSTPSSPSNNHSSSNSSSNNSDSSTISSINRSNRNSKIIRINSLSSTETTTTTTETINPQFTESTTAKADNVASTTTESTPFTVNLNLFEGSGDDVDDAVVPANSNEEPFWWLPIGWRLDRNSENFESEQPLLLRFWSAFPSNQAKVRD